MKLGLGSFSATWAIGVPDHPPETPLSALGFLAEAHRLGVRVVQICDNLPLLDLPPKVLEAVESTARSLGLAVELGTRGIRPVHLRRHLDLARRFHSPFLRVVLDQRNDEPTPDEAYDRLFPLRGDFLDAGIRLAIENHDRFPSATLAHLVERLGTEWVGVCLDTVNSFGALEGPDPVIERLAPHTLSLHVKDFTVSRPTHQMGFLVEGCPAGQGRLNLKRILARLNACHRDVNAILETWVTPGPSLEETIARERRWTESGVAHLRRLIPD